MNLTLVSNNEVFAQSMCEHINACFELVDSGNRQDDSKLAITVVDSKETLAEQIEASHPAAILVQATGSDDPAVIKSIQWSQNHKGGCAVPIIAICDGIDDLSAVELIKSGVHEIIDFKSYTQRTTHRTILTAIARATLDADRRNRERDLLAIQLAEEQAANEKTYFVSVVSHEIRSPLQNIIGFSSLLEETELDDEQTEYTSYLNRNATHLAELVSDILDHSKLDRGTIALNYETISPAEAVEDAISFVETRALGKRINIEKRHLSTIPAFVEGDKLRIIQILKNLLDNAIKFTPENGSISVDINWTPPETSANKGLFECEVRDTGSGIASERIDHIFAPFAQGDPGRDQSIGGTGLGLALCKRLCEMMKGTIQIKDTSSHGTTILFAIPFEQVNAENNPLPTERLSTVSQIPTPEQFDGANILVVEDDKHSRAYIERFIRYSGLACDVALDGQQAVEMFRPGQHFLIVTDVFMPRINGVDLCSRIRSIEKKQGAHKPSTIFAISAGGGEETRRDVLKAGADHYLQKPIRIDQLRQMIRDALPKKAVSN